MDASVMLVAGVIVLVVFVYIIAAYNRLVRLRATVKESWADVDTELRRRHDLIPNLVETVKGYATHERAIMEEVVRAREAALTLSNQPAALAQQENVLAQALKSLLAIAENYPDLKASQNFKELQLELSNTEDRIQAARRFYNANVRENNIAVASFPSSLIAGTFGFGDAEFFEIEDAAAREPVAVSFS